jgi:hypothetical protein
MLAAMTRRIGWACWLGVLLLGLGGAAAEESAALDAKQRLYRRTELRSAAGRWITHRLRFPSRCPVCQGAGAIPWSDRGRPVSRECQQCRSKGIWISPPDYRAVYYDMRSPAFQALPDIQRTLEAQYKEASQGRPWPTRIQRYKIRDWELVDATHGLVWFQFDGARSATASRWIWIPDEKVAGRGRWGLHDERADGPWPAPRSRQAGAAAPAPTPEAWGTVPAEDLPRLRAAVAGSTTSFWASEIAAVEGTLRVSLEPRHADDAVDLHGRVAGDALALTPLLLDAASRWARIETEWHTWWRDADGIVRLKPSWTVVLERGAFQARPWADLDTNQRMGALRWRRWQHDGWTPWTAKPAPPPVPSPTPEPAPAPEPAPEVPPTPEPAPPEAKREPPPALQASGRKRAEAGVAKMKDLLAKARAAHDDGVLARRSGSHELWQEKLNEARALLGEIEDVWTEDVLSAMPGRDDAEREELANEHFGSIWDEVYELKSVVRKTSQLN